MFDILMVVPRYIPLKRQSYYEFPLGKAYTSPCLTRAGHSVAVVNLNQSCEDCYERMTKMTMPLRPKLVLKGGLSIHHQQIRQLMMVVRDSSPASQIVVGGAIVTASPALMFDYLEPNFKIPARGR